MGYANVAIACILSIVFLGKVGADWMPPDFALSQEQWMDTPYGKQVAASFSLVLLATLAGVAAGLLAFGKKQWKRAGVACIIAFVLTCLSFVWFIRRCDNTFFGTICGQLDFEWFTACSSVPSSTSALPPTTHTVSTARPLDSTCPSELQRPVETALERCFWCSLLT